MSEFYAERAHEKAPAPGDPIHDPDAKCSLCGKRRMRKCQGFDECGTFLCDDCDRPASCDTCDAVACNECQDIHRNGAALIQPAPGTSVIRECRECAAT